MKGARGGEGMSSLNPCTRLSQSSIQIRNVIIIFNILFIFVTSKYFGKKAKVSIVLKPVHIFKTVFLNSYLPGQDLLGNLSLSTCCVVLLRLPRSCKSRLARAVSEKFNFTRCIPKPKPQWLLLTSLLLMIVSEWSDSRRVDFALWRYIHHISYCRLA